MTMIKLQSFNFREFFVRHQNFEGELMKEDSPGFADDFIWDEKFVEKDGNGFDLVRLVSKNNPGMRLRHKNFRMVLERKEDSDQFRMDSTFRRKPGLTGSSLEDWVSYESINFGGHFIRHRDFHLFMDNKEPKLAADATFKRIEV